MAGGLCRVAGVRDGIVVSNQVGGVSKDIWVLASEPERDAALETADKPLLVLRCELEVPAHVADNVFWVGRYAERADAVARVLRQVLRRRLEPDQAMDNPRLAALTEIAARVTGALPTDDAALEGKHLLAGTKKAVPWEDLLALADLSPDYRQRNRGTAPPDMLVGLIVGDETHPRSIVYQLRRLEHLLSGLSPQIVPPQRSVEDELLQQALEQLMPAGVPVATELEAALDGKLSSVQTHLTAISDQLTRHYFSRPDRLQQLVVRGLRAGDGLARARPDEQPDPRRPLRHHRLGPRLRRCHAAQRSHLRRRHAHVGRRCGYGAGGVREARFIWTSRYRRANTAACCVMTTAARSIPICG